MYRMETSNDDWKIDMDGLEYLSCIQERPNSNIYKCKWRNEIICVKILNYIATKELNVLSKCVHPKICQFLGGCVVDKKTYIFMEYMDNGSLTDFLNKHIVSPYERIDFAIQIAIALQYLFDRRPNGILHRDIKPENFLIGNGKKYSKT